MARFVPGQTGNPNGRPPNRDVQALLARLQKAMPEVLERVVEAAKGGDLIAARLLLERTIPALRAIDLPAPITLGADLGAAAAAIQGALAAGSATPDQAQAMAAVLASLARVTETTELADRVAELECKADATA